MKQVRNLEWLWMTRLTPTRLVNPDHQGNQPISEYDIILIDATETPVERPKKNKDPFTQAKRKDIL